MKIRVFLPAAAPFFCFGLIGCNSEGVEAVTPESKTSAVVSAAPSSSTAPKTLPRSQSGKRRAEAPGPLPAPDI